MIQIVLHRSLPLVIARSDGMQRERGIPATDGKGKAPTSVALMWLGEWGK